MKIEATSHSLRAGIRWIAQTTVLVLILAVILFLSAGKLEWLMAWVYLGVFFVCLLFNGAYLARRNPELLKERSEIKPRQGVEKWDIVLSGLVRVFMLAALVVCGLDQRLGWTGAMPLAAQLFALAIGILGFAIIMWALTSNPFAAVYARIQAERGHAVAMTGPYRFVRHPFYSGVLVYVLALLSRIHPARALSPGAGRVVEWGW